MSSTRKQCLKKIPNKRRPQTPSQMGVLSFNKLRGVLAQFHLTRTQSLEYRPGVRRSKFAAGSVKSRVALSRPEKKKITFVENSVKNTTNRKTAQI